MPRRISGTVDARPPPPSSDMVTSDVGVIGVARLMRTATWKASFCSSSPCSSSLGSAPGVGGPSAACNETGSPKLMWMSP